MKVHFIDDAVNPQNIISQIYFTNLLKITIEILRCQWIIRKFL